MRLGMIIAFTAISLAQRPGPGRTVDSVCWKGFCDYLMVRGGTVIDCGTNPPEIGPRVVTVGKYVPAAQALVPKDEAPVYEARTPSGWTVVASGYLDKPALAVHVRTRFFDPSGKVRLTASGDPIFLRARAGRLFGGADEEAAVCESDVHAYTDRCRIWWLPPRGSSAPIKIFDQWSTRIAGFNTEGPQVGVVAVRQTEVNGDPLRVLHEQELWLWDAAAKTLTKAPN